MKKYPRTRHLEGSRKQSGDEDLDDVPFEQIAGKLLVVEEKIDGANAGISFSPEGQLLLQSRGHYLTGGPREKHFNLLKAWASAHQDCLRDALGSRYVLYGEWMFAKHTVFYDALPHLFMEFDVLDTEQGEFLSTPRRRELLQGCPVVPVPVVKEGRFRSADELAALIGHSLYKTAEWRESLRRICAEHGLDHGRTVQETDPSDLAEGLYLKLEEGGRVVERFKFIPRSFLSAIKDADGHWLSRPICPNVLAPGVELFGGATG